VAALKITIRRCRLAGGASQASQPTRPWLGRFLFGYLMATASIYRDTGIDKEQDQCLLATSVESWSQ